MDKVKTTLLIDKTLKKLAQVYAIQHETTLQGVVEEALTKMLVGDAPTEIKPERKEVVSEQSSEQVQESNTNEENNSNETLEQAPGDSTQHDQSQGQQDPQEDQQQG